VILSVVHIYVKYNNHSYQKCIHFPVYFTEGYFQYNGSTLNTENYRSVLHQTHYDVTYKNNKVIFEGLDIHYHIFHGNRVLLGSFNMKIKPGVSV
jgi:hypothetical protein